MKEFFLSYLNSIGLLFNLFGVLLIIFYIVKDPKEFVDEKPEEKWYAVYIKHPNFIMFGIVLIVLGFLLSFIDSLLK